MSSSIAGHHTEWLSLIEVNGPFLTLPVLTRVFPQGLEPVVPDQVKELRRAHAEWLEDPDLYGQWIRWVLSEILGFDQESVKEGPAIPATLAHAVPEHGETLRPDIVVVDPETSKPRVLVGLWSECVELDERLAGKKWSATPLDRMTDLLRAKEVALGLVTNGERWVLVHAPSGKPSAYATWEASIWLEERATLDAFATLLGVHRTFGVAASETLEALLAESADAEHEVTDQLGKQVRQAVELLVDAFGRKDREHRGALLEGVEPRDIYQAAVTVMMRLVFLLSAEERGLFLLGDPLYDGTYAVSTLRGQLQEEADRFGEEPLERRSSAWSRLLATFRLVYGGVEHEDLRLPAYGGSLFDPDRFLFLEGRMPGESWRDADGRPVPVDDRTVLHILDALQVLCFRTRGGVIEARRLSFRAVDVEQIGHVYEGLLDHEAVRVSDPAVGFGGKLEAERALELIERERERKTKKEFVAWLAEESGLTAKQVDKALDAKLTADERARLLAACDNDEGLAERIEPFFGLLREDLRGLPQVYVAESVYVTKTLERRASGTYYTPRSLAEEMVEHALEPLVYGPGPAEDVDRATWKLKSPAEILDLKICDMAMGSGAFLVAACRYLADRLTDAWAAIEHERFTPEGKVMRDVGETLIVPDDPDDRLILARRLVADRCLYGVDKNPMAVEMGKLSVWLITLAKDRPFSFVDHALKCGDSLLGITDLAQIEQFHMDPAHGRQIHSTLDMNWTVWQGVVKEAVQRRRELEGFTVLTVRDAEHKERLLQEADEALDSLRIIGDAVIGAALATAAAGAGYDLLDTRLLAAAADAATALNPEAKPEERAVRLQNLRNDSNYALNEGRPPLQSDRLTFHWPIEFPEVLVDRGGFDAIVGNPPFQGGQRISGALGADYRAFLVEHVAAGARGSADLVSYFFLRAADLIHQSSALALLATNTIAQGDTRDVCLDRFLAKGWVIYRASKSTPWPGDASIEVAQVWIRPGSWEGPVTLEGLRTTRISASLDPSGRAVGLPHRLARNTGLAFQGAIVLGLGFVLRPEDAAQLLKKDKKNKDVLFPYVNGEDLNSRPDLSASRWVINFSDWSYERAADYNDCMAIVDARVRPDRERQNDKGAKKYWWRFLRPRPELLAAIEGKERVVAIARVSSTAKPVLIRTDQVFHDKVVVWASDDYGLFGLLSSDIHYWWAIKYSSTLRTDLNYAPTDCFETFPRPENLDAVARIGRQLEEHRRLMMLERQEGLTRTYNRVHNASVEDEGVVELRRLHTELDTAVSHAYGWGDLLIDHDFHNTPQGTRHTLGLAARLEVMDRLLELNHERYKAEVLAGLHGKRVGRRGRSESARRSGQETLEGIS